MEVQLDNAEGLRREMRVTIPAERLELSLIHI